MEICVKEIGMDKNILIEFSCPRCKRTLAWANKNAIVYCKVCDKWIRAKDNKQINPTMLDPDSDQLILF